MNNNRNNNRRRGRGNNRQQGGGQQLNRIDSRARGNAPQLLEKYKKLAQDAHMNGDRVQAEYFLQFADHYFRVIADQRSRQEEQRRPRDERFGEGASYDESEDGDFGDANDIPGFDQPYRREEQLQQREPRRDSGPRGDFARDNGRDEQQQQREPRGEGRREPRQRDDRPAPRERFAETQPVAAAEPEAANEAGEGAPSFEPAGGNPFTRGNRGLRPRRERAPMPPGQDDEPSAANDGSLDPALLPPAITEGRPAAVETEAEAPAPKRRGRPRKVIPTADSGEPLETVTG